MTGIDPAALYEALAAEGITVEPVAYERRAGAPDLRTPVRATHEPTGISVICDENRSQFANRDEAVRRLRLLVADAAAPPLPVDGGEGEGGSAWDHVTDYHMLVAWLLTNGRAKVDAGEVLERLESLGADVPTYDPEEWTEALRRFDVITAGEDAPPPASSPSGDEAREALRELHDAADAARNRSWVDVETTRRFHAAMGKAEAVLLSLPLPGAGDGLAAALRAKLAELELHDDLPDSHDIGYMACWRDVRAWLDETAPAPRDTEETR